MGGSTTKRKFSLTNFRLKTSQPAQHVEQTTLDYDIDSPPYSPTASEMERPMYHPQLVYELRQACATLVAMTNPPDPDDEDQLEQQRQLLRQYEAERKAKYAAQVQLAEAEALKKKKRDTREEKIVVSNVHPQQAHVLPIQSNVPSHREIEHQPKYSTRQPRQESHGKAPTAKLPKELYIPKDTRGRSRATQPEHRILSGVEMSPNLASEPVLPPVHAPLVERSLMDDPYAQHQRQHWERREQKALGEIRSSMHLRPKTSAAACVDYESLPTGESTESSSRSNSDFVGYRQGYTSTGMTSIQASTPNMVNGPRSEHRWSKHDPVAGLNSLQQPQDQASQRAYEQTHSNEAYSRSASRSSRFSRTTSRSELDQQRSSSRAGSFASSIASGISSYMRPRGGTGHGDAAQSLRSGRSSALGFSRSHSRSSSMSRRSSASSGGWWRNGGLRRRGSWASFRSGGPGGDARERNRLRKDGGPNLNRPLPALPGLDQYKETKTHIGQMVKSKKKVKKSKIGLPQPLIPPDTPYTATLAFGSRSHSNLGHHSALSGEEDEGQASPRMERRSTHPEFNDRPQLFIQPRAGEMMESVDSLQSPRTGTSSGSPTSPTTKAYRNKMRRSSLNPLKPRRQSVTADTSENDRNLRKQPPPMIRGPSYKRELNEGTFPRPMEVHSGNETDDLQKAPWKQPDAPPAFAPISQSSSSPDLLTHFQHQSGRVPNRKDALGGAMLQQKGRSESVPSPSAKSGGGSRFTLMSRLLSSSSSSKQQHQQHQQPYQHQQMTSKQQHQRHGAHHQHYDPSQQVTFANEQYAAHDTNVHPAYRHAAQNGASGRRPIIAAM